MSILPLSLDSRNPKQVLSELRRTYGALKGLDNPKFDVNDRFLKTQVEDLEPVRGRVSAVTHNAFGAGTLAGEFSKCWGRREFLTVETEGKQEVITEASFPSRWSTKKEITVTQLAPDPTTGQPLYRTLHIEPLGDYAAKISHQELSAGDSNYPAQKVEDLLNRARQLGA